MTALQRRVYMMILRCLFIIMHHIFHHQPGTPIVEGTKLTDEMTKLLVELDKSKKVKE